MSFSSLKFIFIFLPAFILLYGLSPKKFKNAVIAVGSIVFYCWGFYLADIKKPLYIASFTGLLIMSSLLNYILGQFIQDLQKTKRFWLCVGIIINFLWLIFFKYLTFGTENIKLLFGTDITVKRLIMPVGISFYTFQNVSYITDVYRGKSSPERSFINYFVYNSMFPQLVQGPIVRYRNVSAKLRNRSHTIKKVETGLKYFTIGLGYKVLIADQIGGLWHDISMIGFDSISTPLAWLGIVAYSFQLYFDFNGYSLMAIGLGKLLGFELPKNFDYPYMSLTMTEFWRRWHMTLGSWFKDYVYIPLGGNRKGKARQLLNLLAVWLFTGIWHGASWNFIIWGLVLYLIIVLEKFCIGDFLNKYKIAGHLWMFLLIPLTWLIFAVTDIGQLGIYFRKLVPLLRYEYEYVFKGDYLKYWKIYRLYFIAGAVFSTRLPKRIFRKIKDTPFMALILLAVFWLSVYCIDKGANDPFMYYTF